MSFLASIGTIIEGSGLSDILQTIYPNKTVGNILSGKAFSRAIRVYFIVYLALYLLALCEARGLSKDYEKLEKKY
ncbi:hypothetical protein PR048_010466 [Dryococelus australis]|uniref:Uncharacterized protein n=1 Tax=Dryococelus australis TaxID=614101 RepID=A0ABQ9I2S8_9NEOP|nr:hypothetical protein PR048_010466 [Dryococelus australis]